MSFIFNKLLLLSLSFIDDNLMHKQEGDDNYSGTCQIGSHRQYIHIQNTLIRSLSEEIKRNWSENALNQQQRQENLLAQK